jgi:Asp-tRNA(Asn)/Glu-tRNA(Gln) amidotransferase A subunit family amidase
LASEAFLDDAGKAASRPSASRRAAIRHIHGTVQALLPPVLVACLILTVANAQAGHASGFEVVEATISRVHAAYESGELSAHELVQLYLDRIEAYDQQGPGINCILSISPNAFEQADEIDAYFAETGRFVGPLHGIPILVKDSIDAVGMATTHGTVMFQDYRPPLDAFAIAQLKQAGAIILGKPTLGEFSGGDTYSTLSGNSRNPYALDYTVGGSSGGSGGALAASFSLLALGEETGSSIKRPTAWGALAGMRPTPGLVSRSGMWDGHPGPTAQMGPMARTVEDMAKLLDGMVGFDPEDPITALGVQHTPPSYTESLDENGLVGARIGVIRQSIGHGARPESEDFRQVDRVFQRALRELEAAGATLVDVDIPDMKDLMARQVRDPLLEDQALRVYLSRNPSSRFETREDIEDHPEYPNSFKARVRKYREGGFLDKLADGFIWFVGGRQAHPAQISRSRILESMRAREQLMLLVAKAMAQHRLQAIVFKSIEHSPTLIEVGTHPPYRHNGGAVTLNSFLIYTPIVSVPMGVTGNGIPAGITFMGLPYSEPVLIRLAYAYEQATHHRRPPDSTPPLVGRMQDLAN